MSLTAFMFSVCLNATGECHEEKLAQFDSQIATEMCDVNQFSYTDEMTRQEQPTDRKRTFVCRAADVKDTRAFTASLVYRVCEKGDVCKPEVQTLGKFYGYGGMKLCEANKKYWKGAIEQGAKLTGTEASLSCDVAPDGQFVSN